MTTLVYFAAASLDGYIAGPHGELDWLQNFESPGEDHGYADFLAGVDGLVMGRDTFEVSMSFGAWPYGDRPCWVLTHRDAAYFTRRLGGLPRSVQLSQQRLGLIAARWETLGLKRVWLVGGGDLASQFARDDLIDEIVLSSVPVCLGAGRPLFAPGGFEPQRYTQQAIKRYETGIVASTLVRQRDEAPAEVTEGSMPIHIEGLEDLAYLDTL